MASYLMVDVKISDPLPYRSNFHEKINHSYNKAIPDNHSKQQTFLQPR